MISVVYVISTIVVLIAICIIIILLKRVKRATLKKSFDLNKYRLYCNIFTSWMVNKNKGKTLEEYFKDHNYKSIAIYGLDRLGMCLYGELMKSDIDVKYAIDSDAKHFQYLDVAVVAPTCSLDPVDAIIVANVEQFDKITVELHKKGNYNIISLEDIIDSL